MVAAEEWHKKGGLLLCAAARSALVFAHEDVQEDPNLAVLRAEEGGGAFLGRKINCPTRREKDHKSELVLGLKNEAT